MNVTINGLPNDGDTLIKQYFSNVIEIRANMTGTTMTGTLIASVPLDAGAEYMDTRNMDRTHEIEAIFDRLIQLPGVINKYEERI